MRATFKYILLSIFAGTLFSCEKSHEGTLLVDNDAVVTAFKVNGIEASIDDQKQTIEVILPWSNNLATTTVEAVLPQGATLSPAIANPVDLSTEKKYRVYNGNLYWDYTVTAKYPKITDFSIEKYKGVIDEAARTITVKYPEDLFITELSPVITTDEGVSVTPSSRAVVNFTTPVEYTLSYAGESVTYTVEVEPTSFTSVGFLGVAASASAIANDDEKAAYQWFSANVPNATYISFADVNSGKVSLSDYKVIWWHLDTDGGTLPGEALTTEVINRLSAYYKAGGSFFFSTWAVQYVANLGIAKEGKKVNNMWNENNSPNAIGEDWGISFKGNENHDIFKGLSLIAGRNNGAFLLSKGSKAKDHSAIWNFEFGDYANDIPRWTAENGAVQLASFHWDDAMSRAVMFEYPSVGNSGKVICIGIGSYDWFGEENSPENAYRTNIERLTANILEYLAKK